MPDRRSIVLLPGLVSDSAIWAAQADALRRDYDVIAIPDFNGHRSLDTMADAVLAAAPDRFALAGHSMGARVALAAYAKAPERVTHLALLDVNVTPADPGEAARRRVLLDTIALEGMAGLARAGLPFLLHPSRLDDGALADTLTAMIGRATPEIYTAQAAAMLARPDMRPLLPKIACPTLVLCGDDDRLCRPDAHRRIAAAIAGARLVVIPECGHLTTLEKPEAVTAALQEWLE